MLVSQLCPTLYNPMDCNPPDSFVHGILQARILELVAFPLPRHRTQVTSITGRFFYHLSRQGRPTWKEGRAPKGICREAATQMMLQILLESQETANLPKYGCPQAAKPGYWPQALCPPHLWLRLRSLSLELHQ